MVVLGWKFLKRCTLVYLIPNANENLAGQVNFISEFYDATLKSRIRDSCVAN